jgi:hypothetical protein
MFNSIFGSTETICLNDCEKAISSIPIPAPKISKLSNSNSLDLNCAMASEVHCSKLLLSIKQLAF